MHSASRKIAKLRSRRGGTVSCRQAELICAPAALPKLPAYMPPTIGRICFKAALCETAAVKLQNRAQEPDTRTGSDRLTCVGDRRCRGEDPGSKEQRGTAEAGGHDGHPGRPGCRGLCVRGQEEEAESQQVQGQGQVCFLPVSCLCSQQRQTAKPDVIQASKLNKLGSSVPRASLGHCVVNFTKCDMVTG